MPASRPALRAAVVTVGALSLALSACSGGGDTNATGSGTGDSGSPSSGGAAPAPANPGTFTIGVSSDPGNLDPSMTVLSVTRSVARLSYDTLIHQKDDGTFVSGLATKWEVTPTSVDFTLGKGITCSDGTELTATDVKDNIDYIADPKNQSPLLGIFLPPGVTTKADDAAGTVSVTAAEPNAFLVSGFTNIFMVCRAGLDDHTKLAQATIGTGPWVLTEAVADDHYSFKQHEGYAWGPDGSTLDEAGVPKDVDVRVVANTTTLATLVLSGEVNSATLIGADAKRLEDKGIQKIGLRSPLGEFFFNQDKARPGNDPAVRKALIGALDLNALGTVGTGGQPAPSEGLVTGQPKVCPGNTVEGNLPPFDVDAANAALDAAGWVKDGDVRMKDGKPLAMTFIYPAAGGDSLAAAAELVEQMWTEVGVQVTLQAVTSTQLNEVVFATGAWDAGWIPLTVNLPSQLAPFLSGPATPDGTNFAHLDNATYNASSAKALTTGEVEPACALWNEAETALVKDADVVPMFDSTTGVYYTGGSLAYLSGEMDGSSLRLGS